MSVRANLDPILTGSMKVRRNKMKFIIYHENNKKHPYLPQEDSYNHSDKFDLFVVADGLAHNFDNILSYPMPSESYQVANIITKEIVNYLSDKPFSAEYIPLALFSANRKVASYNHKSNLYQMRESNGFNFGASSVSFVWLKDNTLLYAVLDNCLVSTFNSKFEDNPKLTSYTNKSGKYFEQYFEWENSEHRKIWRKSFRNKLVENDGEHYGYGALDGGKGFEKFLQVGEFSVDRGDLVMVYTDGFIKLAQHIELIRDLKNNDFSQDTFEMIKNASQELRIEKEMTSYIIKI